jgi:hypothetical protein
VRPALQTMCYRPGRPRPGGGFQGEGLLVVDPGAGRRCSPVSGDLSRRFADAFAADDIDGVVALLTDDAWHTMPPAPHQYQGAEAIASFLRTSATWRSGRSFRLVPTAANAQPAFGCYLGDERGPITRAAGLIVLTLDGERISAITRFLDTGILRHFGLPQTLPDRRIRVSSTPQQAIAPLGETAHNFVDRAGGAESDDDVTGRAPCR